MGDSGGTECRPMGGKHGTQEPEGRGSSPALPESLSLSLSHTSAAMSLPAFTRGLPHRIPHTSSLFHCFVLLHSVYKHAAIHPPRTRPPPGSTPTTCHPHPVSRGVHPTPRTTACSIYSFLFQLSFPPVSIPC